MVKMKSHPVSDRRWSIVNLCPHLDAAYDWLFSDAHTSRLKTLAVSVSVAGFAIHLVFIFLARSLSHPPLLIAEAGQDYLSAISTPFNFILFYEVLALIGTLAASTTQSIAGQFEIVSLIFIRDVFRDIARANDLIREHRLTMEALPLFVDMWSGFLMFFLVAVFRHVALQHARSSGSRQLSTELGQFVSQKRAISIGLTILLIIMAGYNLSLIGKSVWNCLLTGSLFAEPATTFYNDLFTVMIFADVLILILSIVASGHYEMVFRNAAFVVAIILVRFALTEGYPYGAGLALMAMVFGILTLLVYKYHARMSRSLTP
jgi:hypothetical protein